MKEPNFLILSEEPVLINYGYYTTIEVIKEINKEFDRNFQKSLGQKFQIYTSDKISLTKIVHIMGLDFNQSAFIKVEDYRDKKINEILK